MIIEAAPRQRVGSLESRSLSSGKSEPDTTTFLSRSGEVRRCYVKLEDSGNHSTRAKLHDREKTRADLLDSDLISTHYSKNRRTSRRGHPYRDSKGRRRPDALHSLLSALFDCKCQSLFRQYHREKAIEILGKFSPNWRPKIGKRVNKSLSTLTSIFTANANENNDNVHDAARCAGEFVLTNPLLKSSTPTSTDDEIFDVEIEDTTFSRQFISQEETYNSRKTHNTNPLSSTTVDVDHPNLLLSLDDIISRDSRNFPRAVRGDDRESVFSYATGDIHGRFTRSKTLEELIQEDSCFDKKPGSPTFETLAAFVESQPAVESAPCSSKNAFYEGRRSSPIFHRLSDKAQSKSVPAHLRQQSRGAWEAVNKSSACHKSLLPTLSPAGVIYNNNGNAASAALDTNAPWTGRNYSDDKFSIVGRYNDIPLREGSPLPSHAIFFSDNRRCVSSLAGESSDTDLRDLETSRVPPWAGARPATISYDRRKQKSPLSLDSLIDLQATSRRTADWAVRKESRPATQNTKQSSSYNIHFPNKSEKSVERFQSNSCQARTKESKAICLSANNHHNAPWFSSEERSFEENVLREKGFSFESFQLHPTLFEPFLRESPSFFNSAPSGEMGCIQSIAKAKVSPDRGHHSLIVEDIQAAIDRTATEIEEKSPIVLRYRTPYFRASAHVIVPPIPRKETWTVGWIQACDSMKFINQYGSMGSSSWEIPALQNRRITAVSDSDGVSYPWYGNTTEIATVEGPTDASRSLTLRMNDNFYPSVTWDIPVSEGSEAHLTHIVRDQSFTTWLAAVNQTTGRLEVLRTVKWHFYLEIEVDPTQDLGKRARIISPPVQRQPIVLKNNSEPIYISTSPHRTGSNASAGSRQKRLNRRPGTGGDNNSNNHTSFIPKSALIRPSANNAQTLIWRPTRDVPVIVVPAKEEYHENNEVVWFTRTPASHGYDHNVRVLSMQEMSQLQKSMS